MQLNQQTIQQELPVSVLMGTEYVGMEKSSLPQKI